MSGMLSGVIRSAVMISRRAAANYGLINWLASHRPKETGVSKGENSAVACGEPIPLSGWRSCYANYGLIKWLASHRPKEAGVSKGENSAVACGEPIPLSSGRSGYANYGLIGWLALHRTKKTRVSEGEDSAVTRREPVASTKVRSCNTDGFHFLNPLVAMDSDGEGQSLSSGGRKTG
jgi:hypothetical protein